MKIFISRLLYGLLIGLIFLFIMGYFFPIIYIIAQPIALILGMLIILDLWLLFGTGGALEMKRQNKDRFSNGDENEVILQILNGFRFGIKVDIFDELPPQFQIRSFKFSFDLLAGQEVKKSYMLRPVTRGIYEFGNINALIYTKLGLFKRRIIKQASGTVKVYPSFIKLHQYELMAISHQLTMHGQKRVRRVGNSREFDTITDYVPGDDPRHVNWKATARRGHLMTNHFIDERSQNVYCIIDKSRPMRMPFNGMTLLDYAINASLVISDVSLKKEDKAGILTFEDKIDIFVKSSNRNLQLHQIMEALYPQETSFKEPDFASVYHFVRKNINQRSLLLFFTNFESIYSLNRQLKYLKMLNREHLLLVIYFRNTAVDEVIIGKAANVRQIYDQSIAYQMLNEKIMIREALQNAGILSLYSTPENLNVNVINKYIEVKTKRLL